jgi:hypothetical protein
VRRQQGEGGVVRFTERTVFLSTRPTLPFAVHSLEIWGIRELTPPLWVDSRVDAD